jgi:hypothetical protein
MEVRVGILGQVDRRWREVPEGVAMKTPEGTLKSNVDAYLKEVLVWPDFALRMNSGRVRVRGGVLHLHPEGTADYQILRSTGISWLELKKPGKDTTPAARKQAQDAFRDKVTALGHRHLQTSHLDAVIAFLEGA